MDFRVGHDLRSVLVVGLSLVAGVALLNAGGLCVCGFALGLGLCGSGWSGFFCGGVLYLVAACLWGDLLVDLVVVVVGFVMFG